MTQTELKNTLLKYKGVLSIRGLEKHLDINEHTIKHFVSRTNGKLSKSEHEKVIFFLQIFSKDIAIKSPQITI